ncbi:MAG TPA: sigma 54-interacting transcriptional regulator [Polyangiaceae bacterium]|nr:sigma 54-interacting transcriptional regulator [Polyangiaceae bacterium]
MGKTKTTGSRTLDHVDPAVPEEAAQQPALIAVFPTCTGLPVPAAFAPAGRKWFAARGVRDREISTSHCHFRERDGVRTVRDVGSRNGTWLDGRRLERNEDAPLVDRAVLRVGRTVFVYRARLEGGLAPSPPLGELVAPFGLREVTVAIEAAVRRRVDTLLIEGETGTGKELLARHVAQELGRSQRFVPVNVAGVAAGVFESQLFGHVAGAFSDARSAARGVIIAHDGGTVFLDEIGELPRELQPKLLRLIENREVLPVGAERPSDVDILLVAATNRDLDVLVSGGDFRRDLHARLAVNRVWLPSLSERREDILAIANALAPRYGVVLDAERTEVEAIERLLLQAWPANVRGLMAVLAGLAAVDREPGLRRWALEKAVGSDRPSEPESEPTELTRDSVQAALDAEGGNETRAAQRLGVSRGKLRRFLQKG